MATRAARREKAPIARTDLDRFEARMRKDRREILAASGIAPAIREIARLSGPGALRFVLARGGGELDLRP
jgi:hypothetical protein